MCYQCHSCNELQYVMNATMLPKSSGLMIGLLDIYKKYQKSIQRYGKMMSMSQTLPEKLKEVGILKIY